MPRKRNIPNPPLKIVASSHSPSPSRSGGKPIPRGKLKKRPTRAAERRRELRDEFWPGAEPLVWNRLAEKGFTTVPRTIPIVMTLIKELTNNGDASRVYLDLWCRAFDEGIVEINDEEECALSSGYPEGTRHIRSWRERVGQLVELGFIAARPKHARKYGYVLVLHPHQIVCRLHASQPERIPGWWWRLYSSRMREIRAPHRLVSGLDSFLTTANG